MKLAFSVFVICHNEVERLGMVLESVKGLTDDLVIVDSGSTDGTLELAKRYTDRVYHRDWTGFGAQKVYGESLCKNNWVLNLDADEVVSPLLREEIIDLVSRDPDNEQLSTAFEVGVTMMRGLDDIKEPSKLAPTNFTGRLYDKRYAGFSDSTVHDKLQCKKTGNIKFPRLKHKIYHYSIKSYKHMWDKIGYYSELQARDWMSKGREAQLWKVTYEIPLFFAKHYFFRRLFALGSRGLVIAICLSAGRALRRVIVHERRLK
jgi:glycosyltransferase involved in cell wall biosynthesis